MYIPNTNLPDFSESRISGLEQEILSSVAQSRDAVSKLLASNATPVDFVVELDRIYSELHETSAVLMHLNSVSSSDVLREMKRKCLPVITEFYTDMGQSLELYRALDNIAKGSMSGLSPAQRRFVETELRDFSLSGINLPEAQKQRVKEINTALSEKSRMFSDNVLDATQKWSKHVTDISELEGLPEGTLAKFASDAQEQGLEGYLVKIDMPSYFALMRLCSNRALRAECHRAYSTRCSSESPLAPNFNNQTLVDEILALRHERAVLVGLCNHAQWSLVPKMAESTDDVVSFLRELGDAYRPLAQVEFAQLSQFAQDRYGWSEVYPWDVSFLSEKLREETCAVSDKEIRPYFPVSKVLSGMFEVAHRLFGISFEEVTSVPVWHQDVRFFRVCRGSEIIAGCYLDLYARSSKRGGAWMDGPILRRLRRPSAVQLSMHQDSGGPLFFDHQIARLQLPVTYLCCNFTPPTETIPSLLSHEEVSTLFHEFGHGLHLMLTRVDLGMKCGTHVEWDGVELPSQLMENWIWEEETMPLISGHYLTGETLPTSLLQNLLRAKNFQVGLRKTRQLNFALFDFLLHLDYDPNNPGEVMDVAEKVWNQVSVVPHASYDRYPLSFSHIFGSGYDAGYFSYLWAEVLSCAVYERMKANAIFDPVEGERFVHSILSRGGEEKMLVMVQDFLGAKPTIDSMLRSEGIVKS